MRVGVDRQGSHNPERKTGGEAACHVDIFHASLIKAYLAKIGMMMMISRHNSNTYLDGVVVLITG